MNDHLVHFKSIYVSQRTRPSLARTRTYEETGLYLSAICLPHGGVFEDTVLPVLVGAVCSLAFGCRSYGLQGETQVIYFSISPRIISLSAQGTQAASPPSIFLHFPGQLAQNLWPGTGDAFQQHCRAHRTASGDFWRSYTDDITQDWSVDNKGNQSPVC